SGTPFQFRSHSADLLRPGGFLPEIVQREAEHEGVSFELLGAPRELGDGWPLSSTPHDEASRRRHGSSRIAHGESDPPLPIIYCQNPAARTLLASFSGVRIHLLPLPAL